MKGSTLRTDKPSSSSSSSSSTPQQSATKKRKMNELVPSKIKNQKDDDDDDDDDHDDDDDDDDDNDDDAQNLSSSDEQEQEKQEDASSSARNKINPPSPLPSPLSPPSLTSPTTTKLNLIKSTEFPDTANPTLRKTWQIHTVSRMISLLNFNESSKSRLPTNPSNSTNSKIKLIPTSALAAALYDYVGGGHVAVHRCLRPLREDLRSHPEAYAAYNLLTEDDASLHIEVYASDMELVAEVVLVSSLYSGAAPDCPEAAMAFGETSANDGKKRKGKGVATTKPTNDVGFAFALVRGKESSPDRLPHETKGDDGDDEDDSSKQGKKKKKKKSASSSSSTSKKKIGYSSVMAFFENTFSCSFSKSPFLLPPHSVARSVALWVGKDKQYVKPGAEIKPLELVFDSPAGVKKAGLNRVILTVPGGAVASLLEGIDKFTKAEVLIQNALVEGNGNGNDPGAVTSIQPLPVLDSIEAFFARTFRVDLTSFTLSRAAAGSGVMGTDGRVKPLLRITKDPTVLKKAKAKKDNFWREKASFNARAGMFDEGTDMLRAVAAIINDLTKTVV